MKYNYVLKNAFLLTVFVLLSFYQSNTYAQVSLSATGGVPAGAYTNINDAFTAINAGTHTGDILIAVNANTVEPAAPVYLAASGQLAASYTNVLIKPTAIVTIAGATSPGYAVINLDGADNVMIDGSIAIGGTTRDLTIQNTAANTIANVACIRLMGRATLGLGATNVTVRNCNIIGNTPGNNGLSGSTVTATYGIYAGSTVATTMAATSGGADYDNLTIQNNFITNAYIGINVIGLIAPNQADNLQVLDNSVGDLAARIGFKGIVAQHVVGGSATNNLVSDIEVTTGLSIAGIDMSGSASNGFAIRRNTISNIHSYNTGGWGAYGINITSGINYAISNNVIHGIQGVNYLNGTTFNAFGIRLSGGTGHQVYYNSVNMYGAYATGSATNAFSAALVVTSTAVTGLDIRNNVFANKMTSTATSPEFLAVSFPAAYNFLNANLERNAYFVSADAQHFVGKIGTTAGTNNYSTLNNWRVISQVNNATNDVNSHPATGNSNAPFTSDSDLTVPAATVTVMESTGLPIASLGLPNVDRTNVNRPAGTGTNPDLGAYEFEGLTPGDLVAPVVSGVTVTPGSSCSSVEHMVTAVASDNVGVTVVTLSYSYNGVPQTPITMTLTSGTALNGTYEGTIPAAAGPNVTVTYSVSAIDAGLNSSGSVSGTSYTDDYLTVTASADQMINVGVGTAISATTPSFGRLMITEIVQFKTGTGQGVYPAHIPVADNDFVEISNYGDVAADASGFTLSVYGGVNGTYTIPANTIIPSGGTLVLAFSGTASDPANLYFGMNIATTSSGGACGYVLKNPQGAISDAVATNSYVFPGASGVGIADWTGNIASSTGLAGVRRTVATDNDVASDWTLSAVGNEMTIGVYNPQITIVPVPQTIVWTTDFDASSSNLNPLPVAPFAVPGVYTFTATYNDGTCTATDDVVITVIMPTPPVAIFSATPLAGSAPLNVAFTDLSTNLPDTWLWTISPMAGVSYVSGTSASQNPVVQFANAGLYTITLFVSNIAGSDDSTIVQYINVDYCISSATNTADTDIGNVTFGALNNGSAVPVFSNPAANALYTNYTALPAASFDKGQSYPISLSQITGGATFYSAHFNVFIDYNNDGAFDPVTERVFNGATSNVGPISDVTGSVTIPATAVTGIVRMRVILNEAGNATSPPCGTYTYGETEDYLVELVCPMATSTVTVNSCGSYIWAEDGNTYASSGMYPYVIVGGSAIGCDSTITLDLTVNVPTSATETVAECVSYTWPIDGNTYSATGMYTAVIPNAAGCDSTITLDLTINTPSSATQTVTECENYTWAIDGMTYSSTGLYTAVIPNAAGCDSTITLDLTILNATSSSLTVAECDSYTWSENGNTYTNSGIYTATLTNAAGCDSTITLDLTILNATSSSQTVVECDSYTWSENGSTYTNSGIYTVTLTNAAGCDSTITLDLTINTVSDLGVTLANATLTADLAPGGGVSYAWLDCDNGYALIPGATAQSYTPTVNGNYAVEITENGCADTSACYLVDNVGLNTEKLTKVSIVPNPTVNNVTVTFEGSFANLTILDLNGKVLSSSVIKSGDVIDLSSLENGVYIFNMHSETMQAIERVVKQ